MYKRLNKLETPEEFNFPFTPYKIQQQLMTELYKILEQGEIGIFESPTGTGKSLTLTCAALKWLEDNENEIKRELEQRSENMTKRIEEKEKATENWFDAHTETLEMREEFIKLREMKKLLREYDERIQTKRTRIHRKYEKQTSSSVTTQTKKNERNGLTSLDDWEDDLYDINDDDQENIEYVNKSYRPVQIYFCSRTHAQLSQIVKELKGTIYGKRIRCISLASRQYMCINKDVKALKNGSLINERCLNMIANSKKDNKTCNSSLVPGKKRKVVETESNSPNGCCRYKWQPLINELSDLSLHDENILDIEDIVQAGEEIQACPYYAARKSLEMAQLILLPYQLLLHHKTRLQTGINLKDNIIIIDEAHNLLDTMIQMYSCELNLQQLEILEQQILSYKERYNKLFHADNLLSINQILFIIKRLIENLNFNDSIGDCSSSGVMTKLLTPLELMSESDFFNINIYDLLQFCSRTRFVQKLQGFLNTSNSSSQPPKKKTAKVLPSNTTTLTLKRIEKFQRNNVTSNKHQMEAHVNEEMNHDAESPSLLSARLFIQFLECLVEKTENGRILIRVTSDTHKNYKTNTTMKYLLLNPHDYFHQIVNEARAIIIAGGTMQPIEELKQCLFPSCLERVKVHCYDHVVPSNAILPMVVTKGPSGRNLNFNYTQRATVEMLNDLTTILKNLSSVIPAGLICFLPSFDYLDVLYNHLQTTGALNVISTKKCVFREPHIYHTDKSDKLDSVEKLLSDYTKAIRLHKSGGALLLSVVGAKLSEGLNFTNDLGRGVIVVGLPYPNRHNSPELQERMTYLKKTISPQAGQEYYENLCIKAVNQCIGRAVRHIKDYACVYLLDERYDREYIKKKLPQWISRHIKVCNKFGEVQSGTVKFFKQHKSTEA